MNFVRRRIINISIIVVLAAVLVFANEAYSTALYQSEFLIGWVLLFVLLLLSLYRIRKPLSMLPIGSSASWVQLHVYGGVLSIFLFGIHTGWQIPDGWFNLLMATLFVLVAGSGIFGMILMRTLPRRLTRRGEEVIWERIPVFRRELKNMAEQIVMETTQKTHSNTIAEFYSTRLSKFFSKPKHRFLHLIGSDRALFALFSEFENLERYMNDKEKGISLQLKELVVKKNDLDFHHVLQRSMRLWLLVHVPLTYSMLLLTVLHAVIVHTYRGGL